MKVGTKVKHHLYGIGVVTKTTTSFLHVKFNDYPEEKRMLEEYYRSMFNIIQETTKVLA